MPENLRDMPFGILPLAAEIRDLHHDLVSADRPHRVLRRNKNVACKLRIVRYRKTECLPLLIGADHAAHASDEYLCDAPLAPAAMLLLPQQRYLHRVKVKRTARVRLGDIDIGILPLDRDKSEPARVRRIHAHQAAMLGLCIFPLSGNLDLSLRGKRV